MLLNFLIPLIGVVVDQMVKYWASTSLRANGPIPIWEGVFQLNYQENTGAAFSILTGQRWLLLVVTVVLLAVLLWALFTGWMKNSWGRMSLRLIIAGAIGNMIDRFLLGYVVDMLDFCLIDFPVFNVADVLLCVGVGMMCFYILVIEPKLEKQAKEGQSDGEHPADSQS